MLSFTLNTSLTQNLPTHTPASWVSCNETHICQLPGGCHVPQVGELSPPRPFSPQKPITRAVCHLSFWKFSWALSWVWFIILEQLKESRKIEGWSKSSLGFFRNFLWKSLNVSPTQYFTYWITSLLQKDITQEQPDGRDTRGKAGGKGMKLQGPVCTSLL